MSVSPEENVGESGHLLDWALVDSHGDLEDGDSSSTTSSVEIMETEELESGGTPVSASPTGSLTGPKFVLRLASREHLACESDEEPTLDTKTTESQSFDLISSLSERSQTREPHSSIDPAVGDSKEQSGTEASLPHARTFKQQISQNDIEDLVQAITEVQTSVYRSGSQQVLANENVDDRSLGERYGVRRELSADEGYGVRRELAADIEIVGNRAVTTTEEPADSVQSSTQIKDTIVKAEGSSGDVIVDTVRRIDKLFNCVILLITASFIIYVGSVYILGNEKSCARRDERQYVPLVEKLELEKKIVLLQDQLQDAHKQQEEQLHTWFVDQRELERSLEKCKIQLNDAEIETSDLKTEVMKLRYSVQKAADAPKQEPVVSQVALGDTPYIQCGPGKVMKRHHESDGDMMYYCDWDKNHVPKEEVKKKKEDDIEVPDVKAFCEKIMDDNGKTKEQKKQHKSFMAVCKKTLKPEKPVGVDMNYGPLEDNNIPCQSCYQKLTQVENNWAKSEQEREAAMSRAELWKELYTKEVERTASTDETEEDIGDDETEVKPEPVSLQSCWNFVMKNFTAGNHLFQSFGQYWDDVERMMPSNFTSLFDFWINAKWRGSGTENFQTKKEDHYYSDDHQKEGSGRWYGSDTKEEKKSTDNLDWGDTVLNVLNKTKESVTSVNKQIQHTWKKIENISNHLWKKHEPSIAKLQNSFANKISKLSQKFQEKIIKQTEHWFEKASKRNEKKKGKTTHKDKPSPKKPHVKNGQTKRRSHINLEDDEKQTVDGSHIKVPRTGTSDKQSGGQNNYCHVKFEKLRKAANNLHWRAKNLDAWNKLADEYRHIGEKLLMYNMYQVEHEENMPVDQRDWYDCQLLWWSNNLQDKDEHIPDACDNKLERFQLEKTVVAPSEWKKLRMMDTGDAKRDACFFEKLDILYDLLQYKLDLFRIDMCRHRIPPCSYREHLYLDPDELQELFQDSVHGGGSDRETHSIMKNWLFERAESREDLRKKDNDFDETDYEYDDDDKEDDADVSVEYDYRYLDL